MSSRQFALFTIVVLGALNAWVDYLHVRKAHSIAIARPPPLSHYSFVEDDYPPRMPLPSARRAAKLTFEDSVRYSLDAPETFQEWLWTATVGDGNVHLGHNHRLFVVGITHQLHCLRSYRQALTAPLPPTGHALGHLTHCINFFRMSTLCAADTTLEPPDAFARNYTLGRAGGEHVCMDWLGFYDEMKTNYVGWQGVQKQDSEHGQVQEVHVH